MKIKSSNNAFLSSKIDKPPRKHGKSLRLCEKRYKTDHLCRERIWVPIRAHAFSVWLHDDMLLISELTCKYSDSACDTDPQSSVLQPKSYVCCMINLRAFPCPAVCDEGNHTFVNDFVKSGRAKHYACTDCCCFMKPKGGWASTGPRQFLRSAFLVLCDKRICQYLIQVFESICQNLWRTAVCRSLIFTVTIALQYPMSLQ